MTSSKRTIQGTSSATTRAGQTALVESCKEAEDIQLALLLALERCEKEPHITLLVDAGSVNGRKWSAQSLLSLRSRGMVSFELDSQEQQALDAGEAWIKPFPVRLTAPGRALAREVVGELASYRKIESTRTKTESEGPMDDVL